MEVHKLDYEDRCEIRILNNSNIMKLRDKSIEVANKAKSMKPLQKVIFIILLICFIVYIIWYLFKFYRSERKSIVLYSLISIFILCLVLYYII